MYMRPPVAATPAAANRRTLLTVALLSCRLRDALIVSGLPAMQQLLLSQKMAMLTLIVALLAVLKERLLMDIHQNQLPSGNEKRTAHLLPGGRYRRGQGQMTGRLTMNPRMRPLLCKWVASLVLARKENARRRRQPASARPVVKMVAGTKSYLCPFWDWDRCGQDTPENTPANCREVRPFSCPVRCTVAGCPTPEHIWDLQPASYSAVQSHAVCPICAGRKKTQCVHATGQAASWHASGNQGYSIDDAADVKNQLVMFQWQCTASPCSQKHVYKSRVRPESVVRKDGSGRVLLLGPRAACDVCKGLQLCPCGCNSLQHKRPELEAIYDKDANQRSMAEVAWKQPGKLHFFCRNNVCKEGVYHLHKWTEPLKNQLRKGQPSCPFRGCNPIPKHFCPCTSFYGSM